MAKKTPLQQGVLIFVNILISFLSWILTIISLAILMLILSEIALKGNYGNEGGFMEAVYVTAIPVILSPLAVIPAYFLSMRLAEYLREKHGWEIKHPRRLFIVALATPIIIFILLSVFVRSS